MKFLFFREKGALPRSGVSSLGAAAVNERRLADAREILLQHKHLGDFSRFVLGKINESIHAEDVSGVMIFGNAAADGRPESLREQFREIIPPG